MVNIAIVQKYNLIQYQVVHMIEDHYINISMC